MKVRIIIDFVCPYCFVATEIMWKYLGEKYRNIDFEWLPYELHPISAEPIYMTEDRRTYFEEKIKNWAESEGIVVNFPKVNPIPRTNLAFQGMYFAKKYNLISEYIRGVMEAYWIRNEDIGSIDLLTNIAKNIDLNSTLFKNALLNGEYEEAEKTENFEVSEMDFEVVPTFFIDDKKLEKFPKTLEEFRAVIF